MKNNSEILKIGISGGTFDPIHIGHLIVAEQVSEFLALDKIFFIPVGLPPHKNVDSVTSPIHRLAMVKKAIKYNPTFKAIDIEVKRKGFTYSIDTLKILKQINPNASFYYIIGSDVLFELETWKSYETVLQLCQFVAVLRPGYKKENLLERIDYLEKCFGAKIHTFEVPLIGISSTHIREKIALGQSIKYLVPDAVSEYILNKDLYR